MSANLAQAEKEQQLWALYENNNDRARRTAGDKRQAIACSEIFSSHSLQSQGKMAVCILISMHKYVKITNVVPQKFF